MSPSPAEKVSARITRNTSSAPAKSGSASSTPHPSSSNTRRPAFTADRIRGSTGTPPRSFHHATRAPVRSRSSGSGELPAVFLQRNRRAGIGSGDAPTARSATSATRPRHRPVDAERATRRASPARSARGPARSAARRRCRSWPGLRSEPPMSLPSAIGSMPQASATAAPPLLPPQVLVRSQGLRVAPNTALKVCEPAPNSGVLVLPMVIAAGRAQPLDDAASRASGHEVPEHRRAEGGADAAGRLQVLVRDRQAVQRAAAARRAPASSAPRAARPPARARA